MDESCIRVEMPLMYGPGVVDINRLTYTKETLEHAIDEAMDRLSGRIPVAIGASNEFMCAEVNLANIVGFGIKYENGSVTVDVVDGTIKEIIAQGLQPRLGLRGYGITDKHPDGTIEWKDMKLVAFDILDMQ